MYDPVKEKLTREINKRCEEKLQRAKVKKVNISNYNILTTFMFRNINSKMIQNRSRALKHDYHTSAWDKFINKTQKVNDDLLKGHFTRSKQRDKDEVSSKRTMDPNYYDMGK